VQALEILRDAGLAMCGKECFARMVMKYGRFGETSSGRSFVRSKDQGLASG